jgi:hypothetical protein
VQSLAQLPQEDRPTIRAWSKNHPHPPTSHSPRWMEPNTIPTEVVWPKWLSWRDTLPNRQWWLSGSRMSESGQVGPDCPEKRLPIQQRTSRVRAATSEKCHKRTNTTGLAADTERASSPPITIDRAAALSRNCRLVGPVEMDTIYPLRDRGGCHARSTKRH